MRKFMAKPAAIGILSAATVAQAALVGNPGDLYVSGQHANTIYEVNPTNGVIVGSAPTADSAAGIRFGSNGNLYVVNWINDSGSLVEYNGTTGAPIATTVSGLDDPYGLVIANNLFYVSESLGEEVQAFNSSGTAVYTITNSDFGNLPLGMVVSPGNRLLVGTRNGTKIDGFNLDGSSPSTFASNSNIGDGFGLAYGPNGNLYESNAGTNSILEFNATTGAYITSITGGGLDAPLGIAFGPNGDLYAANNGNNTVSVFNGTSGDPITTFTGFDGVYDLTFASVPEPTTGSLLLIAGAGTLMRRRRHCAGNK